MKAKIPLDPNAAFPNPQQRPRDSDLSAAIGDVSAALETVASAIRESAPTISTTWHYSSRVGWYQQWELKKRRLLYVVPKRGDVRLSLILGDKAIAEVKAGPFARAFGPVLKAAKRYPEGTGFTFEGGLPNPQLVVALLHAKLNH